MTNSFALTEALDTLAKLATDNSAAHGFYDDEPTDPEQLRIYNGNRLMLIVSEVAEAFEELRAGYEVTETYYQGGSTGRISASDRHNAIEHGWIPAIPKPEGIPSELADVLIRVFDFAGRNNIPLGDMVIEKMTYNANRPYKHGKKF